MLRHLSFSHWLDAKFSIELPTVQITLWGFVVETVVRKKKKYAKYRLAFLGEDSLGETLQSPDSGINELQGLSPEEQEKQKQAWAEELANVSIHRVST